MPTTPQDHKPRKRTKATVEPTEKSVQDERPASAQLETSGGIPVRQSVEYDGETYAVDFDALDDIDIIAKLAENDSLLGKLPGMMAALQACLGDDYQRFYDDQVAKYGKCRGTSMGELYNLIDRGSPGN